MTTKNKPVVRDNTTSKKFSYEKNGVVLDFTLRNDIKQQLKDFLELLHAAMTDVAEEIQKVGK